MRNLAVNLGHSPPEGQHLTVTHLASECGVHSELPDEQYTEGDDTHHADVCKCPRVLVYGFDKTVERQPAMEYIREVVLRRFLLWSHDVDAKILSSEERDKRSFFF